MVQDSAAVSEISGRGTNAAFQREHRTVVGVVADQSGV